MKSLSGGWITCLCALLIQQVLQAQSDEALRKRVEVLVSGQTLEVAGEQIYSSTLLPQLYLENGFQKVWTPSLRESLLSEIRQASDQGLNPDDYHLQSIQSLSANASGSNEVALDLLCTDAFLLYASHLLNGKLNPEEIEGEWQALRREGNAKLLLQQCIAAQSMAIQFDGLEPASDTYVGMKQALKKYANIQAEGGWSPLVDGETLKPGVTDERVGNLKQRLAQEGYYAPGSEMDDEYTEELVAAVKKFQSNHGLEADGNVGKQTLAMLNWSVEKKIELLKVNMERMRWINQQLGQHYVFVNIADFTMKVYRNDDLTYQQTVVVGKPARKTPVFSGVMTYLVLNPYWNVPPTILFNDVLPEVKKDVQYLARKNMRVLKAGKEIEPGSIDWSSLNASNFGYNIRQDPGPTNALGAVKFMFPNKYSIYIHDTPSRELFNRPDRAFSSGCIRLKSPLQFVDYLLADDPQWNQEKVEEVLRTGKDKTVMMSNPLNVHILYLTTWVDDNGLQFRKDIYERDRPVYRALMAPAPKL